MSPFLIRAPSLDDVEAIAACHKEAVETKAAAFYGADVIAEWAWTPNRLDKIRGEIQNGDFIYLVAYLGDRIVGYGIANPSACELKSLCGRPGTKGVGASLLAALINHCRQRGCTYLELSSSLNAEAFYLANGFREMKREQHLLESGAPMECIKMRLELDAGAAR